MNWKNVYDRIVTKALLEDRKRLSSNDPSYVYYELHHIRPKSLFPELTNLREHPENGVLLTAREHYFCHLVLQKIYPCKGLFYAVWRMCNDKKHKISSREYERRKKEFSKKNRERMTGNTFNKGFKRSDETRQKIKEAAIKRNEDPAFRAMTGEIHKRWYGSLSEKEKKSFGESIKNGFTESSKLSISTKASKRMRYVSFSKSHKQAMKDNHWLKGRSLPNEVRLKGQMTQSAGSIRCKETGRIFVSSKEVERELHINHSDVLKCCRGEKDTVGGYRWELLPKEKFKSIVCVETEETFESFLAIKKKHMSPKYVVACCEGTKQFYCGLHFRYKEEKK